MSIKIDSPRDALNFVKERCTTLATRIKTEPILALKIVGITLAVIAIIVWLSIILHKHRKSFNSSVKSKPQVRVNSRSQPRQSRRKDE